MAVVMSPSSYERHRGENVEAFLEMRNNLAAEARVNGLDERALRRLLRDDV
jgi:hypothetical protein